MYVGGEGYMKSSKHVIQSAIFLGFLNNITEKFLSEPR